MAQTGLFEVTGDRCCVFVSPPCFRRSWGTKRAVEALKPLCESLVESSIVMVLSQQGLKPCCHGPSLGFESHPECGCDARLGPQLIRGTGMTGRESSSSTGAEVP